MRRRLSYRTSMQTFEQIIGLGGDCQVGHQIERCFGRPHNGIFDWIVTPLDAIVPVLADTGSRFGEPWTPHGRGLQCDAYGTVHLHDFEETDAHEIITSPRSLQNARDKLRHKAESTVRACRSGRPTLFVRYRASVDAAGDRFKTSPLTSVDLNGLVAGIEGLFPDLPFRLLFIQVPDRPGERCDLAAPLSDRVIVRTMALSDAWDGDDGAYDALFSPFKVG